QLGFFGFSVIGIHGRTGAEYCHGQKHTANSPSDSCKCREGDRLRFVRESLKTLHSDHAASGTSCTDLNWVSAMSLIKPSPRTVPPEMLTPLGNVTIDPSLRCALTGLLTFTVFCGSSGLTSTCREMMTQAVVAAHKAVRTPARRIL